MSDKICSLSCSHVDQRNYETQSIKCELDGKWRAEKSACPYANRYDEDKVNHPSHYTAGSVECIDAIKSAVANLHGMESVLTAQVIKYLWRWKLKNGLEDLKKAEWYLKRLIVEVRANDRIK